MYMCKKKLLLIVILLAIKLPLLAQHEADTWYFGTKAGFQFATGSPQPLLNGQLTTSYACAVMSDATTGQPLFYSNGEQVWDRTHQIMPNGGAIKGYSGATQGVLIVPDPGDAQRYYLFTLFQSVQLGTVPNDGGACQLFCSIVDMRLNGGLGDVVATSKNRALEGRLTEKLTAVRHTNGRDYWILAHTWGSNTFIVYALTNQGLAIPVRQAIGPSHPVAVSDTAMYRGLDGHLQASPDGRHLACAVTDGEQPFSLFNFDAATGNIRNYLDLGILRDAFGVSFSPDNSKLYVQNFSRTPDRKSYNIISQFDLTAGDDRAIATSGESIIAGNPLTNINAIQSSGSFYALQNGPDGRLYGASWYRGPDASPLDTGLQTFYVIDHPNALGFDCGVHYQRFELMQRTAGPGLPNFLQHYFNGIESVSNSDCQSPTVEIYPNPSSSIIQLKLPPDCDAEYSLHLYNSVGQQVIETRSLVHSTALDISKLAPGLYVIELRFSQQVLRKKILKY
jgi:hypothetical protein